MAKPLVAPVDVLLRPTFALRVCPSCGVPASWRYDKKGRPFHYCGHCGTRVFIYTITGLVGFEMLHQFVVRNGPIRHRNLINRTVGQRIARAARRHPQAMAP
jgi:hypothetical protein